MRDVFIMAAPVCDQVVDGTHRDALGVVQPRCFAQEILPRLPMFTNEKGTRVNASPFYFSNSGGAFKCSSLHA